MRTCRGRINWSATRRGWNPATRRFESDTRWSEQPISLAESLSWRALTPALRRYGYAARPPGRPGNNCAAAVGDTAKMSAVPVSSGAIGCRVKVRGLGRHTT